MISLVDIKNNQKVKVTDIAGGDGLTKKLENLGIRRGAIVVKVTDRDYQGPVIVKIGHTQVALGKGMAHKVFVEPVDPSQ